MRYRSLTAHGDLNYDRGKFNCRKSITSKSLSFVFKAGGRSTLEDVFRTKLGAFAEIGEMALDC